MFDWLQGLFSNSGVQQLNVPVVEGREGACVQFVADALEQAVGRESPPDDFSLVFHDDQGSQYTSRAFQRCLESHGIAQSMSRPGNPWDNALAESFFKTLKRELVNGKGYKTREEAKQDVFKYIELYYSRQRMRSSIGYNAPCDLERDVA